VILLVSAYVFGKVRVTVDVVLRGEVGQAVVPKVFVCVRSYMTVYEVVTLVVVIVAFTFSYLNRKPLRVCMER
jgi:hypothetical protein